MVTTPTCQEPATAARYLFDFSSGECHARFIATFLATSKSAGPRRARQLLRYEFRMWGSTRVGPTSPDFRPLRASRPVVMLAGRGNWYGSEPLFPSPNSGRNGGVVLLAEVIAQGGGLKGDPP